MEKCRVYNALKPPLSNYDAIYFDVQTIKDAIKLTRYLDALENNDRVKWVWTEIKRKAN